MNGGSGALSYGCKLYPYSRMILKMGAKELRIEFNHMIDGFIDCLLLSRIVVYPLAV